MITMSDHCSKFVPECVHFPKELEFDYIIITTVLVFE